MSSIPPAHEPHSTLEVSERDPETYQKEVIAYPDHSYPQAVPVEQVGAGGATHSFYSPESAKEVVVEAPHDAYAGAGVLPGPYKDPNSMGGVAYQNGYPAGAVYADGSAYSNSAYPNSTYPNSAYPNSAYLTSNGSQMDPSMYGHSPAENGGQFPPTDEKAGKKGPICGLPRKIFFILLGVGIAVIALVGGLAGGLTSKTHGGEKAAASSGSSGSPKDPASSNTTEKLILDNSKITASNWTDSNGVVHRTVLFQDVYNSIIARRWDSNGKSWTTDNLTQLMAATTTPLNPIPGTPLASASMDLDPTYETHVWFTDPSNTIRSMVCSDALNKPDSWDNDTLDDAVLVTWPGSGLAAMWQRCWHSSCDGTWIVAYQRPEGAIKTANSSTWATATVAVDSSDVAANSSLAIIPQLDGPYLDRLELVSERVDSGQTGDMRVTTYNDTWNGADQRVTELQSGIPLPAPSQQFAITKWDSWNQALYLSLLQGGTLKGNHWDGKTMSNISSFNFKSGPDTNFTSIAMTPDAMFYGISNNQIIEYSLDTTDPSTFNYVGVVFP
ncbi:uncharacterized protein F4807DRAFT_440053 [Annulohypoxylon truncatum]|uniref:uncharacterized protein n=1 Tax=Annulohypoxylon truncatum TaxID=327061 RepID=UPI0020074C57|nr:uncharacterized protein F4807DRAFT_440053 [Annulohypoxylon truncatum]KAI1206148.1 hypothetical protein F4807DRAFT_440053 [Annulohypoxylon truncatum]